MNKFNKGKKIGILTATLATVALAGVGFSTWIIGIQDKTTNGDVNIMADDVKYKSLTISTAFDGNIVLAETAQATDESYFNYESNASRQANMTTKAKFTLTIGRDYDANDFDFDQISLSFAPADDENNIIDNKPASKNAVFTQAYTDALTYFDVPATIAITPEDKQKLNIGSKADDGSLTKTGTFEKEITFTWGSMFGDVSPMNYYNTQVASKNTTQEKNAYVEEAVKELDAMHAKYDAEGAKFKLNITFGKKNG